MVGNRRLADIAARGEVAGTDKRFGAQLAEDRQSGRVGCSLEEEDVRIGLAFHALTISTAIYIVNRRYSTRHEEDLP